MPRTCKINLLPQDVRQALADKLRFHGYGSIVEVTEWLQAQGHDIGKTAVGSFARSIKHRDQMADALNDPSQNRLIDLRLRCAEIAVRGGAQGEDITAEAEGLLRWASESNE